MLLNNALVLIVMLHNNYVIFTCNVSFFSFSQHGTGNVSFLIQKLTFASLVLKISSTISAADI